MKTVLFDVKWTEGSPRVELLVRIVYAIVCGIVSVFVGLIAAVAWVLQLLVVLVSGKRNKTLHDTILICFKYVVLVKAYLCLLSDERPPILPVD